MSQDNININVTEIIDNVNIVASEVVEVVDLNLYPTTEEVTINVTEEVIKINVNQVSGGNITKTSDLINDGEDGVNPFITSQDLSGLVPYVGATQDVDLNDKILNVQVVQQNTESYNQALVLTNGESILSTEDIPNNQVNSITVLGNKTQSRKYIEAPAVQFELSGAEVGAVGKLKWNDSDGTLDLGLKGGNVTLQLGQEQVVRVVNKTGSNLTEAGYQAVYISGAQGQRLKVDLALANSDITSGGTLGIVTENIAVNQEGFVTTNGLVRGINTTGSLQGETWNDGDMLYLSPTTAGIITNIKPTAPNHTVIIGVCVYAHINQGSIFVKVDNGYELEELHNVTDTNYTTPINTDSLLTFDVTNSLWKRLSWSNVKSNLKTYFDDIYTTSSLIRQEFTFSGSQTFTLSSNYAQVYSVEVQGQGALSSSQYSLVAPNQITINDTLETGDYVVIIYSSSNAGTLAYYTQAQVDAISSALQTQINGKQATLGFTPEDSANKSTSILDIASSIKFPVWSAVVSYVTGLGYQTASQVSTAITSALASFKTTNFLDATSSIQTQLNNKANAKYVIKQTSASSAVTGTVAETQVLRVEIPANSLSLNEIINMPLLMFSKTGILGSLTVRLKISTSATMPSGTTDAIATYTLALTNLFGKMQRDFIIDNGTIKIYPLSSNTIDNTASASPILTKAFNPAVTNYLYISMQLANSTDSAVLDGFYLTN